MHRPPLFIFRPFVELRAMLINVCQCKVLFVPLNEAVLSINSVNEDSLPAHCHTSVINGYEGFASPVPAWLSVCLFVFHSFRLSLPFPPLSSSLFLLLLLPLISLPLHLPPCFLLWSVCLSLSLSLPAGIKEVHNLKWMHVLITVSQELNDLQPLWQFMCKREPSVFISTAPSIYMDNGVKTLSRRFTENGSCRRSKPLSVLCELVSPWCLCRSLEKRIL